VASAEEKRQLQQEARQRVHERHHSRLEEEQQQREAGEKVARAAEALLQAIAERDNLAAVLELNRVNQLLAGQGIRYPQGALGVEDLITSMGVIQLHEDEAQTILDLIVAVRGDSEGLRQLLTLRQQLSGLQLRFEKALADCKEP
jgi:hypothetical protein